MTAFVQVDDCMPLVDVDDCMPLAFRISSNMKHIANECFIAKQDLEPEHPPLVG